MKQLTIEQLRSSAISDSAQIEAWKALVRWVCEAPDTADAQARQLYAADMVDGRDFDDWYDYGAGREEGCNAPPPAVLLVLRPHLLGKQRFSAISGGPES